MDIRHTTFFSVLAVLLALIVVPYQFSTSVDANTSLLSRTEILTTAPTEKTLPATVITSVPTEQPQRQAPHATDKTASKTPPSKTLSEPSEPVTSEPLPVVPVVEPTEVVPEKTPITNQAPAKPIESIPEPTLEKTPVTIDAYTNTLITEIHHRTNLARAEHGLPKLTLNTTLSKLATERSNDMAARDYLSHTSPDGCDLNCNFAALDLHLLAWGENIAWFSSKDARSAKALAATFMDSWLKSSTHRENLLSKDYTQEGIGVAYSGEEVYVTVEFAEPK